MFFSKIALFAPKSSAAFSYIAKGTKLTGNTEFVGDVMIGGEVNGQILSQGTITIEHEASILGEVKCKELSVAGYFKGRLICERLIIQRTGVVDGDVASTAMQIMEGGQFIGMRIKEEASAIHSHPLNLAAPTTEKYLTPEALE